MVKALTHLGTRSPHKKKEGLKLAVFEGNLDLVRRWLNKGASTDGVFPFRTDPSSDSDSDSDMPEETHSMLTLAQNNVEIMRLLLEHGADPTLHGGVEGDGDTPLQLACGSGVCAVVRLLLDHGVDPDAPLHEDESLAPMCAAAAHNRVEVIRMLLDHGASTGLVRLASPGRTYGGTPLGTACTHGHVDAARLLLDNGADIELKNHARFTPLVCALNNAMPAVVRLLLSRGADVERRVEVARGLDYRYQLMAPVTMARTRYTMVLEARDVHAAHINAAFDLLFLARCVVAGRREEHAGSARRRVLFDRNLVKVIATFLVVKTPIPESHSESESESDSSDESDSSSSSSESSHDD